MTEPHPAYERLLTLLREKSILNSCSSLLSWDEQTYMPPGGGEHRANQLACLAGMIHERRTAPELGDVLEALTETEQQAETGSAVAANIREARAEYKRATQLPRRLVEEMTREISLGQQRWVEARQKAEFGIFQSSLENIISLKREEAQIIGSETGCLYDALLDEYEPGMTSAVVQQLFDPLKEAMVELVNQTRESDVKPDQEILKQHFPADTQRKFGTLAASKIGFDFERGRLDVTAHPFCMDVGPGDCRLTTRYLENFFSSGFFGILHEAGHGMYEQGLNPEAFGTPMGLSVSLGIHESQSLMWENFIGRSRSFWDHFYPLAQQHYPEALGNVELDDFYLSINDVRPSYIRVEADEVTYNLHIMLRFDLEQKLIGGELEVADVPAVWNEQFHSYLGITPENDSQGCLQDIHWSAGLLGYFPTYALGKMYAAQFYNAAQAELGDLDALNTAGDFAPLKSWLNQNIHSRGQQYRAGELVKVVTGQELSPQPLIDHLKEKYSAIYHL